MAIVWGTRTRGTCCICGAELFEANNPDPVKLKGDCCEICNDWFVLPARLKKLSHEEAEKRTAEILKARDIPNGELLDEWIDDKVDIYRQSLEFSVRRGEISAEDADGFAGAWRGNLEDQKEAFLKATDQKSESDDLTDPEQ